MKPEMDCFKTEKIFDAQTKDCPKDVEEDVRKLWADYGLGNDVYYQPWDEFMEEDYPNLAKFLKENNKEDCLIHWWW